MFCKSYWFWSFPTIGSGFSFCFFLSLFIIHLFGLKVLKFCSLLFLPFSSSFWFLKYYFNDVWKEGKSDGYVPSSIFTPHLKLLTTFLVFDFFMYFDLHFSGSLGMKGFLFLFYSYFLGLLLSEPSLYAVRKPAHPDSTWKGAHRERPHVSLVNELLEVGPLAPVEPPQLTPADVPTEPCQIIDSWRKTFIGIVLSHCVCLFVLSMILLSILTWSPKFDFLRK